MVVQVNPENPRAPMVKLFTSPEGEVYTEYPLVDSSREGQGIVRALPMSEVQELKKSL